MRGKLYMTIEKDELVAESSFPIPENDRRFGSAGASKGYFNGRIRFAASYSGAELSLFVRRIESMSGDPASDLIVSAINKMQPSEGFNASLQDDRRKGTPWAEAMARMQKIVVENDHIVATAVEAAPATNSVPLPGETPEPTANPSDLSIRPFAPRTRPTPRPPASPTRPASLTSRRGRAWAASPRVAWPR